MPGSRDVYEEEREESKKGDNNNEGEEPPSSSSQSRPKLSDYLPGVSHLRLPIMSQSTRIF